MRKRVLIMMTALAMTATAVPATTMTAYAEATDTAETSENAGEDVQSEETKKAEEAKKKAEEEAKREAEEEAQRQAEEEARRAAEEEAQRQAEEEARKEAEEAQKFDITYTWTEKKEEDKYICTATAIAEDGTVLAESSEATLEEIPATCETSGQDIYTAVKKTVTQNQNTAQTTKTAPVKTGDSTQPIIPIAAGTGALAAIAAVIMKLRRNRR